jgi:DNA-binding transcriptional MerR regulator
VRITRGDGLIDRSQAAELCGVEPDTVTLWATRGYLSRDGSERRRLPVAKRENGHPLYDPVEVQKAEYATAKRARRVLIRA